MNNKPLKCRLGKGRAGGIEEKCRPLFLSDILLNNPRNQPHRHIPIRINPRHHEAHFILLSGKAVIVAAMGDCVDADMETDENSAFVDVRDRSGIFALNLALAQIFLAGVTIYALDICLYRDVFEGVEFDAQDADKDLLAHMETFGGVSHPVP